MVKINKFSIITILVTFFLVTFSVFNYVYEKDAKNERNKINNEKELYEVMFNPYYLKKISSEGSNSLIGTSGFFSDKNLYVLAQKEFDNDNYEKAISYLNDIESVYFKPLKYDLLGDIYHDQENYVKARESYEISLNSIDKENKILMEMVFSKLQKTIQDSY